MATQPWVPWEVVDAAMREHVDMVKGYRIEGEHTLTHVRVECSCGDWAATPMGANEDWDPHMRRFRQHRAEAVLATLGVDRLVDEHDDMRIRLANLKESEAACRRWIAALEAELSSMAGGQQTIARLAAESKGAR